MFTEMQQSQQRPVILTDAASGVESSKWRGRRTWLVAFLVTVVLGYLGYFLSIRFTSKPTLEGAPLPPTITSVASGYDWEGEREGQLSRAPLLSACLERGAKVYSLNDLSSFPGGPDSKRPWLVFTPNSYEHIKLVAEPDYYYLMFDVTLVNRGEASVAKNWSLCVLQGGKPHRFPAQRYSNATQGVFGDRPSIADITFSKPVEHAHAARGWLLFAVPKEVLDEEGTSIGSLECKDYLDHKTSVGFGFAAPRIRKPEAEKPVDGKPVSKNSVAPFNVRNMPPIVQGQGSITQIGGTGNQAKVENYIAEPPLPTVTWSTDARPDGSIYVQMSVSETFANPAFRAICDNPCLSGDGGISVGGRMFSTHSDGDANDPRIAILLFNMPNVITKGTPLHWIIQPATDKPIKILDVKAVKP
jgi:hypothetical protein